MKISRTATWIAVSFLVVFLALLWYVRQHGFSTRVEPSALEAFVARRL